MARRAPGGAPPLRLSSRRLYILPTRFGGVFALLMIALLIGATNYGNNLAFALAFWLGAITLVSMHRAHRNLAGLVLSHIKTSPVHAGDTLAYKLNWSSAARRCRRTLVITLDGAKPAIVDIADERRVTLRVPAGSRGRKALPRIRLESFYPLGLFRCWAQLAPDHEVLIYPSLAGTQAAPLAGSGAADPYRQAPSAGDDTFRGHRRYRDGDARSQIDWKHSARRDHWLVRETETPSAPASEHFSYDDLIDLGHEARLSQLARWVIDAAQRGSRYRLVLPGVDLAPDTGPAHRQACLDALARQP